MKLSIEELLGYMIKGQIAETFIVNYAANGNPNQIGRILVNYYDIGVLRSFNKYAKFYPMDNLNNPSVDSMGLTESQRQLALKIIYKYRRQFELSGISVGLCLTDPKWLTALRPCVVMPFKVELDPIQNVFCVSFPFNADIVHGLRKIWFDNIISVNWNQTCKYWEIENTNAGKNLVLKIKNVLPQLDVSCVQVELDKFIDYANASKITWTSNQGLTIACASTDQQLDLAEQILSSNLTDFQKISKLAYLCFEFDDNVKTFLKDTYNLDDTKISILCNHSSHVDLNKFGTTEREAIKNFHEFLFQMKLGVTVEHFSLQKELIQPARSFWKGISSYSGLPANRYALYPDVKHVSSHSRDYFNDFVTKLNNLEPWSASSSQIFGVCLVNKGMVRHHFNNRLSFYDSKSHSIHIALYVQYNSYCHIDSYQRENDDEISTEKNISINTIFVNAPDDLK